MRKVGSRGGGMGIKSLSGACDGGRMDRLGVNSDVQGYPSPAQLWSQMAHPPAQVRGELAAWVTWAGAGLLSACELMRPLGQTGRAQDRPAFPTERYGQELTCIVEAGPGPTFLLQLQEWRCAMGLSKRLWFCLWVVET